MAGPAGLQVVIRGANFSPNAALDLVRFGVVQAPVLGASADSLLVRVPVGANYQELTVTSAGLTGYYYTKSPFVETFGAGGVAFSTGSFAAYTSFAADGDGLSVMDLNADGKPDVVSGAQVVLGATEGMRSFSVLTNTGTSGTVGFSTLHFSTTTVPFYSRIADMNGDGLPDMVAWDTVSGNPEIAVYLNNGSGGSVSFGSGSRFSCGTGSTSLPGKIIVRDLDGDGKPDVLTVHTVMGASDTSYFTFLQNTSSGGTVSLVKQPDLMAQLYNTGQRTIADFIVQDFDGDGKPDILSVQQNGFYFYKNTSVPGTISFSVGAQVSYLPPGTVINGLAAADVDGDGHPDLIYVQPTTNQLCVMWNNEQSGTPSFYSQHIYATGNGPEQVAIGDLDGDGKPDLAVSNSGDGTVSVYRNTCVGGINNITFDPQVAYAAGVASGTEPYELAIVDMDGDRRPDIVVANGGSSTNVAVLRNLMAIEASPVITVFSPTAGYAGATVGIAGTNFTGALGVSIGGVPANAFTVNSADSITAAVGNGASGEVVVTTPGGSDTVSGFVFGAVPAPIVKGFTPTSAQNYNPVTITGKHFTNVIKATLGSVPMTQLVLVNDSTITGYPGGGGPGYVAVFTTAGSDSLPGFTYVPQTPMLYSFSPASAKRGDLITISGRNFTGVTGVSFGGMAALSYSILNDTTIQAYVGSGATGSVTVVHYGVSASLAGFTYTGPALSLTSFSPASASPLDTVMIYGTAFSGASAVTFGGTAAGSYTVLYDSVIRAIVSTGSTGVISVTTTQGSVSSTGTFTFVPAQDTTVPAPPDTTAPAPPAAPTTFELSGYSGKVPPSGGPALQWQTINDSSIADYILEEGSDTSQMTTIATIPSQHKASASYAYTDGMLRTGSVWYELLAIDTGGNRVYDGFLELALPALTTTAYPNPVSGGLLQVAVPDPTVTSQFELADMTGRVLLVVPVSQGTNHLQVNVGGINTGTYQLSWTDGKRRKTQTLLILRR